jgi:sulfate adenylyltransferase
MTFRHISRRTQLDAPSRLIGPHGGKLVNLFVDCARRVELQLASRDWPTWDLTQRQLCDLELLMNGGFSPLQGFMTRADHESVCRSIRLANGSIWPIPIVLDLPEERAKHLKPGTALSLRDPQGVMLAVLNIEEIWQPDREMEAKAVYGTMDPQHSGVDCLINRCHPYYVGGRVEGIQAPTHYDFGSLRLAPAEVRAEFEALGWSRVIAFEPRSPMHRAHYEVTRRAAAEAEANLLLHPTAGLTDAGEADYYTRVRCYRALLPNFPAETARLALLPFATRMAGPREAICHAIIRKNYGCTHLIVECDHASPKKDSSGKPFYGPLEAQQLVRKHQDELGVTMVPMRTMVYVPNRDEYVPDDEIKAGVITANISGKELRERLAKGREIPGWFTFPGVAEELKRTYAERSRQGVAIFFTGLSGSGKSTIANALLVKLMEIGSHSVTLLDGDVVRRHLSSELGFSKAHRDLNIRRIGFVASEIVKHGGIAICAPIAPYDCVRKDVRTMVESSGGFVLVYTSTRLDVCERRDRKGLYAKARAGLIPNFTGISDPYEPPKDAEISFDTDAMNVDEAVNQILAYLQSEGYLMQEYASTEPDIVHFESHAGTNGHNERIRPENSTRQDDRRLAI